MFFLPLFQLIWHWRISGSLKFFNLISVETFIVKYLPLFSCTLVGFYLALSSSLETINIFYPIFKIHEHFLHSWTVLHTCDTSVGPHLLWLVVNIIKITLSGRSKINSQFIHFRFELRETFPKVIMTIFDNELVHNILIVYENRVRLLIQGLVISSCKFMSLVKFRNSGNKVLSLSGIVVVINMVYFLNVELTGSKWFFPILFIKIKFISLVDSTGSWCWVSIFYLSWRLVVFVTLNFKSTFESSPHFRPCLCNFI